MRYRGIRAYHRPVVHHDELQFRAGELSLAGTLTIPSVEGRVPCALLVGSWLPRDRDGRWDRAGHPGWYGADDGAPGLLARLAEALAGRGVATLRYDPRGCGSSAGAWEATDLFTRIDDARDAIGALRSRPELDLRRLAIVGHGEGAAVALSVAIADPVIGAVALVGASARSFRDVLRRGTAERGRTGRDRHHPIVAALDRFGEELVERVGRREPEMRLEIGAAEVTLRLAGWEQAFHTPPLALASMLHRSVVLVHGSEDAWADPAESGLLVEALRAGGNDPRLQVVPGAGHDLDEVRAEALADVADALAARIEPRELPPVLVAIEEMQAGG
jgi:uncharacterized protein